MGELLRQRITFMLSIGMRKCNKAGPKFLCSGTELILDIYLHVFRTPPLIASIPFRIWIMHTYHK